VVLHGSFKRRQILGPSEIGPEQDHGTQIRSNNEFGPHPIPRSKTRPDAMIYSGCSQARTVFLST
jgi:hypothetical protein